MKQKLKEIHDRAIATLKEIGQMKKCCYLATDGSALQNREDVEMIRFFECIGGIFINLL